MNPTNVASEFIEFSKTLSVLELIPAFSADVSPGDVIFERTVSIDLLNGWKQLFLSSNPEKAGAWRLEGMQLEWSDSNGTNNVVTSSSDGLHLVLSPGSSNSLTIRLRATSSFVKNPKPLYLLTWMPTVSFENLASVSVSNDTYYVVHDSSKQIELPIDRSTRPSSSSLSESELGATPFVDIEDVVATNEVDKISLTFKKAGCVQLPTGLGEPAISRARTRSSDGLRWLVVLNAYLKFGDGHSKPQRGLGFSERTYTYWREDNYPLDTECLSRSWQEDATGGYICTCTPEISCGFTDPPSVIRYETNIEFAHDDTATEVCTGKIYIGDTCVWEKTVEHDRYEEGEGGGSGYEVLSSDECETCTFDCSSGNCDEIEGDELGSVKFRIPLGTPRKGHGSGFLWFKTETIPTLSLSTLNLLKRADANVTDTTASGVRTIICSDTRGRTARISALDNGISVVLTETANGRLIHTWELTNIERGIRIRKISSSNNIMSDRSYLCNNGVWSRQDNISAIHEEVVTTSTLNDENGLLVEERILRDLNGKLLSHIKTTSQRFGAREKAVLREVKREELGAFEQWKRSFASYWDDPENKHRHGQTQYIWGDDRSWSYIDYDSKGRSVFKMEQMNGSAVPWDSSAEKPLEQNWSLSNLPPNTDCLVTVYDYTPLAGDANNINDAYKVRTESQYTVHNGTATLIARTWKKYTRSTQNNYATITETTTRAGSKDATLTSPGNAVSTQTTYDLDGENIPLILRGTLVSSADEDGKMTEWEVESGEWGVGSDAVTVITSKAKQSSLLTPHSSLLTYKITTRDATYGNTLSEETRLTATDALIDRTTYTYDDKNRLRSTTYFDGSSSTNAYSCCRLLYTIDWNGYKTLRSAKTGEDHLYYAMEEVSLKDFTSYDFRVTQHFFDALGRETNTVVCTASEEGAATNWDFMPASWDDAWTVTEYPFGTSDYSIETNERGVRIETERKAHPEDDETIVRVYSSVGEEVSRTRTVHVRNGDTIVERLDEDFTTEERTSTTYDVNGCRKVTVTRSSSDYGSVVSSVTHYDFLGRVVSVQTPQGVTSNFYDGVSSRVLQTTTTGASPIFYSYNDRGEQIAATQNGITHTTDTRYETISNIVWKVTEQASVSDVTNAVSLTREQLTGLSNALRSKTIAVAPNGAVTTTTTAFNPSNHELTTTTQTDNQTPVVEVAKYGRLVQSDNVDTSFSYDYDGFGRVSWIWKYDIPIGNILDNIYYYYDQSGNLSYKDVHYHDESDNCIDLYEYYEYDEFNNLISKTDALGNTVTTSYDAMNRPIFTDGATYPNQAEYDSQGRKVASSTTRDNKATWDSTLWEYNSESGYLTSKIYADNSEVCYTHTQDGKPLRTTWARGAFKENSYNDNGRLVATVYSSTSQVARTYTTAGQLAAVSESQGIEHAYRHNNRLLTTNEVVSLDGKEFHLEKTYDTRDRINSTSVKFNNQVYSFRSRDYDAESRLLTLTFRNSANRVCSVSHSYSGSYLIGYQVTLPNGRVFSRELTRDIVRRDLIRRQDYSFDATNIYWAIYNYDILNRLMNVTNSLALTRAYAYNARSEVTSAQIGTNYYAYVTDTIGNREQHQLDGLATLYTANNLNQYTQVNTDSFVYDLDGNLTDDTRFIYEYDCENRLVTVTPKNPVAGSKRVTNRYDYQHRRVQKIVEQYADGEWTLAKKHTFVYEDWNLLLEVIEAPDTTPQTIEYFWGNDLSGTEQGAGGVGGLLAVSINGNYYLPLYNHNGNIIAYCDENGIVVAIYTYDAFGNAITQTGTMANTFAHRFSTKYYDTETGFYYYGYRFYLPTLARWLNRDPIKEDGGMNLYASCDNNFINRYDYLGMKWVIERKSTQRWATAIPTDESDTFESLARLIHLDYAERSKWIKGGLSVDAKARKGCKYGIPNVMGFYTSKITFPALDNSPVHPANLFRTQVYATSLAYKMLGFNTKSYWLSADINSFKNLWTTDGIYGIYYGGHGGMSGLRVNPNDEIEGDVYPNQVSPRYKLAIGVFYACESNMGVDKYLGMWRNHIALNYGGYFLGFDGNVPFYDRFTLSS